MTVSIKDGENEVARITVNSQVSGLTLGICVSKGDNLFMGISLEPSETAAPVSVKTLEELLSDAFYEGYSSGFRAGVSDFHCPRPEDLSRYHFADP